MDYSLFDSTGNLIASYSDENEAKAALEAIIAAEPEAATDVALMIFDDEGVIAADPVFGTQTEAYTAEFGEVRDWYSSLSSPTVGEMQDASRTEAANLQYV